MKVETTMLEKYAQIIPSEMMDALKTSAQERGISLDMEIAMRLMVSMTESEFSLDNNPLNQILNVVFSHVDAVSECKRKKANNLYLYEIEKLRLFLRFEEKIPRNVKEVFTVIDAKEESKRIREELKNEKE